MITVGDSPNLHVACSNVGIKENLAVECCNVYLQYLQDRINKCSFTRHLLEAIRIRDSQENTSVNFEYLI